MGASNFTCAEASRTQALADWIGAHIEAAGEGATLTHADWLGLLVDREVTHRRDKRLAARLRHGRLRHNAVVEDVDYRVRRGLDRALFHKLADGEWIDAHDNLIVCGPTGVGKSWLACALGHKACRDNRSVLYQRVPRLFADLALARGAGRHARIMRSLNGTQLLILMMGAANRATAALAAISTKSSKNATAAERPSSPARFPSTNGIRSSAIPPTADAILDRLVHNAQRIDLAGDSLRRTRLRPTAKD
jgi:DNA replication protein DnaC